MVFKATEKDLRYFGYGHLNPLSPLAFFFFKKKKEKFFPRGVFGLRRPCVQGFHVAPL